MESNVNSNISLPQVKDLNCAFNLWFMSLTLRLQLNFQKSPSMAGHNILCFAMISNGVKIDSINIFGNIA
ncbi:hypothetical protein IEQ34_003741 [Dendrobium chrysotoxum]|uniref:Uncharacterized protein n=1 Tax=Dendrobium chrysotoxum TaxID=161865 RepID=A0AAV7HGB8_DENCH|nr:hypothetical protein IEQ34_003741 [Dendrobium chrysotoxum]